MIGLLATVTFITTIVMEWARNEVLKLVYRIEKRVEKLK